MPSELDITVFYYRKYTGSDSAKWFAEELKDLAEDIEIVFWCPIPIDPLTEEQELAFQKAKICDMCEELLRENSS